MKAPYFLVFDVESVGLHGDGFAVGWVLIETAGGSEIASGFEWCDPTLCRSGLPSDREWIAANVKTPSDYFSCKSSRQVRERFAGMLDLLMGARMYAGTLLAADVPWPVEARFLAAMIDDDPTLRARLGPYPLIDIASVRYAKGFDPLATDSRLSNELPPHDPLADARQSARLLLEALRA